MKYCTKCGYQLVDEARFCNVCGAPAEMQAEQNVSNANTDSSNPYANVQSAYTAPVANPAPEVYTNEPKSEEELIAEEQAVLDKFSLGLKHERLAWKISSIVWIIITAFFLLFGLVIGSLAGASAVADGGEFFVFIPVVISYSITGLMYLPIAIISFSMKKKLENYRAKLYTDCRDGIGHFSVGSIVFAAFFNTIAMVFIIVYFIQAKNNASVIERIKSRQDSYNSQI